MKKVLCVIGMIIFFLPMLIGLMLAMPYATIYGVYIDEVEK